MKPFAQNAPGAGATLNLHDVPPAPAPPLPALGDRLLGGKYRLDETLGVGGMGVVMGAQHLALGQKVAFKFLAGGPSPDAARFVREARAAARIDSEHVVRVNDVGVLESGVAYMLMERLYGEDVGTYVRRVGRRPAAEAVLYVLQACDALAAAHAAGVVHRDVKPSNLFLARRADGTQTVKVLDFGISKLLGDEVSLTRTGALLGSPRYMSPEQVRDPKAVDVRTDVWGLGLVLYELLTGGPLYDFDTFPALCMAIVNAPPPPLRAKLPGAPAELESILLRCAEKDPTRRFASIVDLASALAPFAPPEAAPLLAQIAGRGRVSAGALAAAAPPSPPPFAERSDGNLPAPVASSTHAPVEPSRRGPGAAMLFAALLVFAGGATAAFRVGEGLLQTRALPATVIGATHAPALTPPVVSVYDLPLEQAPLPAPGAAPAPVTTPAPIVEPMSAEAAAALNAASAASVAPTPEAAPAPAAPRPRSATPSRPDEGDLDDLNHAALLDRR